jgi:hypothetical protein
VIALAEDSERSWYEQERRKHGILLTSAEDQLSELHRWSVDDAVPSINEHCLECDTKRISLGTVNPALSGVLACPACDLIQPKAESAQNAS